MTIATRLTTLFFGTKVGADSFGNRYFTRKVRPGTGVGGRSEVRWVMYKGLPEPSKVPPEWHGWLHYTTDTVPTETNRSKHAWEKTPLPNLTGTALAYVPPGDLRASGRHHATVAAVEPWTPKH